MNDPSHTILLVDDDEEFRALMHVCLAKKGYSVLLATNGKQGVEFADSHKPDLILMDLEMPVLDGYGAISQIVETVGDSIPIIAVSSHCWNYDWKAKAKQLGCVECVDKPKFLDFMHKELPEYLC